MTKRSEENYIGAHELVGESVVHGLVFYGSEVESMKLRTGEYLKIRKHIDYFMLKRR